MVSRATWTLILAAVVAAATAASCGANNSTTTGSGSGGTTSLTGHGGTGAGLTSAGGGGVNITIGSSGIGGGSSSGSTGGAGGGGTSVACSACTQAGGTCTNGNCTISDNPGSVDTGTQTMLMAGGSADASFAWLYPYDKTVFPRGLTPPTLQFGGTAPTSFYVHVSFPGMDYKGFYASNSVKGFAIAPADWTAILDAAGPTSAVKVDVTKIAGGQVTGPITETWTIAQGNLKGTIYYEAYGSTLVQQSPGGGGVAGGGVGIMKIQPGAAAPTIVKTGCGNVCHTASADGSTLVANSGTYDPQSFTPGFYDSSSYDLKNNASTIYTTGANAPYDKNLKLTYGGIYPDGSFVMSATGYRTYQELPGVEAFNGAPPALYYTGSMAGTQGGAKIAAPGFDGVITSTGTPAFSPDGTMVVFNASGSNLNGGGSTLSVMTFDHATFTFSAGRNVATNNGLTVAWPAFTPDGKWVVYHAGSNPQFETDNGATGDLYVTSSSSDTHVRLDALDGYSNGQVYLPANDPNLSFAPTVLPEAVGGYFWVVFTSHRSYGNTLASKATLQDGLNGAPSPDALGKLWVAAFDINATSGQDPSHPAFYLDGQELEADNLRGFWVLNPCQGNGTGCTSGDDCCGGYCRPGDGGADQCTNTGGGCSNLYESCTKASDCCLSGAVCINNRCAQPPPQ